MMPAGQTTPRASPGGGGGLQTGGTSLQPVPSGAASGATLMATMRGAAASGGPVAGMNMVPAPSMTALPGVYETMQAQGGAAAGIFNAQRLPTGIPPLQAQQQALGMKASQPTAPGSMVPGASALAHVQPQLLALQQQQQLQQQMQQLQQQQQRSKLAAAAAAAGGGRGTLMMLGPGANTSMVGTGGMVMGSHPADVLSATHGSVGMPLGAPPRTQLPPSQLLPMRVIGNQLEVYGPAVGEKFLGDAGSIVLFMKGKQIKHNYYPDNTEQWQTTCQNLLDSNEMPKDASLPVMIHDGRILFSGPESILRYLSKKLGQYGVDHLKDAAADTIFVEAQNWSNGLQIAIRTAASTTDVEEFKDYLLNREVWYRHFESLLGFFVSKNSRETFQANGLEQNLDVFFTGSVDTCCDYFIFSLLVDDQRLVESLGDDAGPPNYFNTCSHLKRLYDSLVELPLIKEFLFPEKREREERGESSPRMASGGGCQDERQKAETFPQQQQQFGSPVSWRATDGYSQTGAVSTDIEASIQQQQLQQQAMWNANILHAQQQQQAQLLDLQQQQQLMQHLQSHPSMPFILQTGAAGPGPASMLNPMMPQLASGAGSSEDFLSRSINRLPPNTSAMQQYMMIQNSVNTTPNLPQGTPTQPQVSPGGASGSMMMMGAGGTSAAGGASAAAMQPQINAGATSHAGKIETGSSSGSQLEDLEPQ